MQNGHPESAPASDMHQTATPENISPAARRALAEAAERRARDAAAAPKRPMEINGPEGPEPTRYGDWESRGIASDF
jgi:hypothetical protein